jgi:hypothetical protein
MDPDALRAEARKLYVAAQGEMDETKAAEMVAQADCMIEEADDNTLMASEREPTEDEIDDFINGPDFDDYEDDDIEFEPDPELEERINEKRESA